MKYSFIDKNSIQCHELAEEGKLYENELDSVFAANVEAIKESKLSHGDKNNIATIIVDRSGVKMDVEYYEKVILDRVK